MKKLVKGAVISLVLALAVVVGVVFAACSPKTVKFVDQQSMMGMNLTFTLTLEKDETFKMVVTSDTDPNETTQRILTALGKTGTYKEEDGVYKLTFSAPVKDATTNQDTTSVTSKVVDGKQTISFGIQGQEATIKLNLKKQ